MRKEFKLYDFYQGRTLVGKYATRKTATAAAVRWYKKTAGNCDLQLYQYNEEYKEYCLALDFDFKEVIK